ncbi:MAG: hypothetical protein KAH56_07265 [Candidatus Krumholzibacteria bacterium]|nr:hypothetical protein [Candidatus Krumholzibacteria bacterium]
MGVPSILHLRMTGPDPDEKDVGGTDPLVEFCRLTTPTWELTSRGAYLDLTGTERLYGQGMDGAVFVSRLARDAGGVRAAGVAPTKLAAGLASLTAARTGGGILAIVPGQVAVFLQSFPVKFLPGRRSVVDHLQMLGVRTLGDLQVVPLALLRSVFGDSGHLLSDEAWGRGTGLGTRDKRSLNGDPNQLELVVGVRLGRPVSSTRLSSALCGGLAIRALTLCPEGPASRGRWRLTAVWSGGCRDSSSIRGPESSGWKSWVGLIEMLWRRLPVRRQGLLGMELRAETSACSPFRQGDLFPADEADQRLAEGMGRFRRKSDARLGPACEDLLLSRGVTWFGPGAGISQVGRGLVDGDDPAR